MITATQIRALFPEFADEAQYPTLTIDAWISISSFFLNPIRWPHVRPAPGTNLTTIDYGAALFVCHNLGLGIQSVQRSELGGPPGSQVGVFTAVSANGASVSYDTSVGLRPEDGQWNLTTHGIRFIQLARMIGAGPIELGIGHFPVGIGGIAPENGGAWPGPWIFNIPNPTG